MARSLDARLGTYDAHDELQWMSVSNIRSLDSAELYTDDFRDRLDSILTRVRGAPLAARRCPRPLVIRETRAEVPAATSRYLTLAGLPLADECLRHVAHEIYRCIGFWDVGVWITCKSIHSWKHSMFDPNFRDMWCPTEDGRWVQMWKCPRCIVAQNLGEEGTLEQCLECRAPQNGELGALGAFGGTRLVGSSPPPKPPGIPDTAEHFDMTFGDSASSGSGASTSNLAPRSPRVQVFACSPSVAVPLRSPTTLFDGLRVVEHDVLGQAHGGKLVAESLDCTLVVMDPV